MHEADRLILYLLTCALGKCLELPQPSVMPAKLPRVVLDTNVCLDLFFFGDPRCARLHAALEAGAVTAVSRADCHAEWERVLHYPDLPITDEARQRARAAYQRHVTFPVLPAPTAILPRCRDPDDQMFLEVALASGATALVSKDNHLLRLTARCGWFRICLPEEWQ
jgi:putative PIN family toxin of toxin-antitoxin system